MTADLGFTEYTIGKADYIPLNPMEHSDVLWSLITVIAENAFVCFEQCATLALMHELFVCACRTEVRTFSVASWAMLLTGLSSFGLLQVSFSRTIRYYVMDDKLRSTHLITIIHRVIDGCLCFLATVAVIYFGVRVVQSVFKSVLFQLQHAPAAERGRRILRHPLLRIAVVSMAGQCAKFGVALASIILYLPDENAIFCFEYDLVTPDECWVLDDSLWSQEADHRPGFVVITIIELAVIVLPRIKCTCACKSSDRG